VELTYKWGTETVPNGARLALYSNSTLTMDSADLEYDHGVQSDLGGTGWQRYAVASVVTVTHNDYLFVGAKTNDTALTLKRANAEAGDLVAEFNASTTESNAETDPWDDPAPTDYNKTANRSPCVGIYYVST
jgi:hypothetical protein